MLVRVVRLLLGSIFDELDLVDKGIMVLLLIVPSLLAKFIAKEATLIVSPAKGVFQEFLIIMVLQTIKDDQ